MNTKSSRILALFVSALLLLVGLAPSPAAARPAGVPDATVIRMLRSDGQVFSHGTYAQLKAAASALKAASGGKLQATSRNMPAASNSPTWGQAELQTYNAGTGAWATICSATVYSNNKLITTASCVFDQFTQTWRTGMRVRVNQGIAGAVIYTCNVRWLLAPEQWRMSGYTDQSWNWGIVAVRNCSFPFYWGYGVNGAVATSVLHRGYSATAVPASYLRTPINQDEWFIWSSGAAFPLVMTGSAVEWQPSTATNNCSTCLHGVMVSEFGVPQTSRLHEGMFYILRHYRFDTVVLPAIANASGDPNLELFSISPLASPLAAASIAPLDSPLAIPTE